MNFELTSDQREIQRTARDFLAARYPSERIRAIAFDGAEDTCWDEIVALGWPDIAEYGTVELAVLAEELGYALAPTPLASHWAAKLLHPGLEGRGTVAMWREGGEATGGGARYIAVAHAATADTIVLADGEAPRAVRAADAVIEPARALDPTRPLFTVRAERGEPIEGDGARAWQAISVMAAAESVGVAARVTQMAVAYAKERKQFGHPIGVYQAVSHACAEMYLQTEGARSVTYWAAWALDHDPDAAPLAASAAKAYASDAAVDVCRSALQVHGGIGFTWEHDLHLFLKRAESNARAYGDPRSHRERVAAILL